MICARPVFGGTEQAGDALSWQKSYAQSLLGETLVLEGHKNEAALLLKAGLAQIEQQKDFIPAYHREALEEARTWGASSPMPGGGNQPESLEEANAAVRALDRRARARQTNLVVPIKSAWEKLAPFLSGSATRRMDETAAIPRERHSWR